MGVPLIGGGCSRRGWTCSRPWAALWAANEIRLRRRTRAARQAAVTTPPPARQLTTGTTPPAGVAEDTDRKEAQA